MSAEDVGEVHVVPLETILIQVDGVDDENEDIFFFFRIHRRAVYHFII